MAQPTDAAQRQRKAHLVARITSSAEDHFAKCTIPGCGRPTRRAAKLGLSASMCTYHVQRAARFGSPWAETIRATDLRPYLATATRWIAERWADPFISHTLLCLGGLLWGAGPTESATNIKRRSAAYRARMAFARLRDAEVKPERLLAIHLATAALIADDRDSHQVREFRIVQTAKAAHRLSSGTHWRWDFPLPNGGTAPAALHVYPKSSGRVLRLMGEELEALCDRVTSRDLEAIRQLKLEKYGPHPSQLPGWRPRWQRERDAWSA
jgi:hypothetical protein